MSSLLADPMAALWGIADIIGAANHVAEAPILTSCAAT